MADWRPFYIENFTLLVCEQQHSQNRSCNLYHIQDYDYTPSGHDAHLFGIKIKSKLEVEYRTFTVLVISGLLLD